MKRPCVRHGDARTCDEVTRIRAKAEDSWPAPATAGRHRALWPGVEAEHQLPFVCGKHVATGGVR